MISHVSLISLVGVGCLFFVVVCCLYTGVGVACFCPDLLSVQSVSFMVAIFTNIMKMRNSGRVQWSFSRISSKTMIMPVVRDEDEKLWARSVVRGGKPAAVTGRVQSALAFYLLAVGGLG